MLPAPQAKLMATLAEGVMHGQLPWALLGLGAALAAVAELAGIASLPFAIGLYLPITTTASLIFGGLIAEWRRGPAREDDPATLFASGLIAGDALLGIAFAGVVVAGWDGVFAVRTPGDSWLDAALTIVAVRRARRACWRATCAERGAVAVEALRNVALLAAGRRALGAECVVWVRPGRPVARHAARLPWQSAPATLFQLPYSQLTSACTPSWSDGQQIGFGAAPHVGANGFGTSAKRRVAVPSPSASAGESSVPAQVEPVPAARRRRSRCARPR